MADLGAVGVLVDTGPTALHVGIVQGIVRDANGDPARQQVAAFDRGTLKLSGVAMSDPITGAYTILTNIAYRNSPHFVVNLDPSGAENGRIFDNISV